MDVLEIQKAVLKVLALKKFDNFDEPYDMKEEAHGARYLELEKETGVPRVHLRPEVLELRNLGYIELMPTVDYDGAPCGSAYFLTEKGNDFVIKIFNIKV